MIEITEEIQDAFYLDLLKYIEIDQEGNFIDSNDSPYKGLTILESIKVFINKE